MNLKNTDVIAAAVKLDLAKAALIRELRQSSTDNDETYDDAQRRVGDEYQEYWAVLEQWRASRPARLWALEYELAGAGHGALAL